MSCHSGDVPPTQRSQPRRRIPARSRSPRGRRGGVRVPAWFAAIVCFGPVAAQTPSETTSATGEAKQESPAVTGLEVYRAQYCGVCHTLDAAETKGPFGPTHNGIGTIAAERIADPGYTGKATTAEEYIRESIVDPAVYIVPGSALGRYRMGAYTMLNEIELDALVQFLLEQR